MEVRLRWEGGLRFEGTAGSVGTAMDGEGRAGASPVALLAQAIGGCAGADVVEILRKGRQDLQGLAIRVSGTRREEPPRYFTRLEVDFAITGDVDRKAAERAVTLSFEKYCSVFHTLRPDLELDWKVTLGAS